MRLEAWSKGSTWFFLSLCAFGGLTLGALTHPWGIGLTPDSASYVAAATSFMMGKGLLDIPGWTGEAQYYTSFGPFYPIVLAALAKIFRADILQTARFLHIVLFCGNIGLMAYMLRRWTGSLGAAMAGALMIMLSVVMLEIHAVVMTEPLYIFMTFLGFFLLSDSFKEGAYRPSWWGSCGLISMACFTRYGGAAALAAAAAAIVLYRPKNFWNRLIECILFMGVAALPMTLWVFRNKLSTGSPAGFPAIYEAYWLVSLREMLGHMSGWLLPIEAPLIYRLAGVFFIVGYIVWMLTGFFPLNKEKRKVFTPISADSKERHLEGIIGLFVILHLAQHFVSSTFVNRIVFDDRHLSPAYYGGVFLIGAASRQLVVSLSGRKWPSRLMKTVLIAMLFLLSFRGISYGIQVTRSGIGYASPQWRDSKTLQAVLKLPQGVPIYTNGVDALYLLTRKGCSPLPNRGVRKRSNLTEKRFDEVFNAHQKIKMINDFKKSGAVVVYFNLIDWRKYYPYPEDLRKSFNLKETKRFEDGSFYQPVAFSQT